jgi:N-acetylglucosamine-6-sulfatase
MARRLAALAAGALALLAAVTAGTEGAPAPVRPAAVAYHPEPRRHTVSVTPLVGAHDRPNVLVIMTDDARNDDLRFMPHVRRLIGDQGVRFTNAFSPQPLCCPARASFVTGQYSHNHHVWSQAPPYGFQALNDVSTLPVWLNDAGYDTSFLGKYLNGYGVQRLRTGGPSLRYVPPGWTDWRGSVDGGIAAGSALDGGTYRYFDTTLNDNGRLVPNHGVYQTTLLGKLTRDELRQQVASPRPFFSWISYVAPHHGAPKEADDPAPVRRADGSLQVFRNPARPRRVWGRFDSVIKHAPGYRGEGDVQDKPFFIRDLPALTPAEQQGVLEDARQRAEALSLVDRQVALTMRTLRQTGQLRNTYVVFTSDNCYFLGEHRMRQGKIKPHEPSLRVPFVVAGPGVPHGERFDPVTTPGVTATIAQLAGATARMPYAEDGISVAPSFKADRGWSVPVVTEGLESGSMFPVLPAAKAAGFHDARNTIGVRTPRYKYVRYSDGDAEMYDLDRDPNELHSVIDDPSYAHVRDQLFRLWQDYKDCLGRSCRAPMPENLRRSPRANEIGTNTQSRGVQLRYGYWR